MTLWTAQKGIIALDFAIKDWQRLWRQKAGIQLSAKRPIGEVLEAARAVRLAAQRVEDGILQAAQGDKP